MKNILSIDLEDWHQLLHRRITGELIPPSSGVFRQIDQFLAILEETKTRATFFTVGMLAERYPELVRRIAAAGHEIACHGYAHLIVHRLTPGQFREDTHKAKCLLEEISGRPVVGYRSPEFSIQRNNLWALDLLAELGFRYDSSIFPIRHRRYGIPDFNPNPSIYEFSSRRSIIELPLSTVPVGGYRVPIAGGGYFRLLPQNALLAAVAKLNESRLPMVTYAHPYEFDDRKLSLFDTGLKYTAKQRARAMMFNIHQNLGRRGMRTKLATLLRKFEFIPCEEYLNAIRLETSRTLLPSHCS